jgi:cytochrome c2
MQILIPSFDFIGNAMAFAGMPNAKDRGDLIAYIKEVSK